MAEPEVGELWEIRDKTQNALVLITERISPFTRAVCGYFHAVCALGLIVDISTRGQLRHIAIARNRLVRRVEK